jgi:hypothetical protein
VSTPSSRAADADQARAHVDQASESLARGLMRPGSLAVMAMFAAAGALLPFTLRHGAMAHHPGSVVQAAVVQGPGNRGGGAPAVAPHAGDVPGEADVAVVSAGEGFGAARLVTGATGPVNTAASAAAGAAQATPQQPKAPQPAAPTPTPTPTPTPAPILNVQAPTPVGPVGVTVTAQPGGVTLVAPTPTATATPLPLP